MNSTHDPSRRSWVDSANAAGADFPIQNLPFGLFRPRGERATPHAGVAIGDAVLDLVVCHERGLLEGEEARAAGACQGPSLNALMALERADHSALRRRLSELLSADVPGGVKARLEGALRPLTAIEPLLPCEVGDYTDFYASVFHATNVGSMFRPDNPLLPNYKYVPIGYHGRASSIVASGTPVVRPNGQSRTGDHAAPVVGPSRRLDYELEVGAYVARGNPLGRPIPIAEAEQHLFGLCLVNDWSARDIQQWEYQPLGPFLAKSFATTVSPWVVTMEALEPFRVPAFARPSGDPQPLAYLDAPEQRERGGVDLTLEVWLASSRMREAGMAPVRLSQGRFAQMYWTLGQMVTHHASNGCNLRPGDLIASGTVSGDEPASRGCLLELTWRGEQPLSLPTGESRRFLEDGDEVSIRGFCERPGAVRIGFGDCRGLVLPARG